MTSKWEIIENFQCDWSGRTTSRMAVPNGSLYKVLEWHKDPGTDQCTQCVAMIFAPEPKEKDNVEDTTH